MLKNQNKNELELSSDNKVKQSKKKTIFKKSVITIMILMLIGFSFGAGYGAARHVISDNTTALAAESINEELESGFISTKPQGKIFNRTKGLLNNVANKEMSIVDIVKFTGPSIVTVVTKTEEAIPNYFSNNLYQTESTGSGIIYKSDRNGIYVITNQHVVENAKSVGIILHSGEQLRCEIVGYDSRNDLALLSTIKEEQTSIKNLNIIPALFGDSESLEPGELAIAIGNPMGKEFSQTVTTGVISAVDRELNVSNATLNVIQTDAAINPGNSGGALINSRGEVIGINTAKLVDSRVEGMGFAIPVHIAIPIIENIEEISNGEDVAYHLSEDRAYLGILIGQSNTSNEVPFGVYVQDVVENAAAYNAGVKAGDVIFSIDGKKLDDANMLFDVLTDKKPGDKINIEVIRNNDIISFDVELDRYGDFD